MGEAYNTHMMNWRSCSLKGRLQKQGYMAPMELHESSAALWKKALLSSELHGYSRALSPQCEAELTDSPEREKILCEETFTWFSPDTLSTSVYRVENCSA